MSRGSADVDLADVHLADVHLADVHLADVHLAADRIAGLVRRTPVLRVDLDGIGVACKLEHTQVTGSFKARGATNALRVGARPRAVVAASGGNHGLGVAWAAAALRLPVTVVVPTAAPDAKARWIAALGATVVRHGATFAEAEAHARTLLDEGARYVHPYDDPHVVAGQGTVGLEVDADGPFDAVLVAVGGGGLVAGVATALGGSPTRVVGVEPEGIPTLHAALAAGHPVDVEVSSVTASALGATRTSTRSLAIAQREEVESVLVNDEEILAARDLLWERCRLAVEPAGAAALAPLLSGAVTAERPCVVLCGANSDWVPG